MANLRATIDSGFETLAYWIAKHKWWILTVILALLVFMVSRLPHTKFDMSTEGFLHDDDPSIIRYNEYREQFGRDEMIVVMIKSNNVFELSFLKKLKRLHDDLEENVPFLNDINSLVNARLTIGAEGELIVEDLLEEMPETAEDIARLKQLVMSNPIYLNLLISEDGKLTTILIQSDAFSSEGNEEISESDLLAQDFSDPSTPGGAMEKIPLSNAENSFLVKSVRDILKKHASPDFPLYLSGSPVVTDYMKTSMQKDMGRFTLAAILGISLFLFALFRRISGVLLPIVTVTFSVVFAFALMELTNTALKIPLVILPSFLLAIGIGASVHLMAIFFKYLNGDNKITAISKALGHSGLPIVMTSLTTAAGLASFSQAEMAPIADLGRFSSVGVLISLVFTIFLIPTLVAIFPIGSSTQNKRSEINGYMNKWLAGCGEFAVTNRIKVVVVAMGLLIFSIIGISRLNFTHHVMLWFPENSEIRQNTELIDEEMKGSLAIEVVIDTGRENGLYEPDFLNRLEILAKRIEAFTPEAEGMFIGKTMGLVDLVKEINQALNENNSEFYSIPQSRKLIAQELLLFENSGADDLEDMVDNQFRKTRLTIKVPWNDSVSYIGFFNFLDDQLEDLFENKFDITVTGITEMLMTTVSAMMNSTMQSYTIAAIVITLLMLVLIGRFRLGLLSMIPNLTPIIVTLGIMGWIGTNLDMFTMLIGSIAIGLAVDDTIHFFHNFRKYYDKTGSVHKAVEETLTSTGRALLITTLVLATGFWLFMFATMQNLFNFGLLTGITLVFAFLADIILAPALVALVTKDR
ncbi:MAG: MMPL family transporter [Proteobacteria bacterium]|nr:MMPL family transporter [Pseudomonadota bacterium]